MGILTRKKGEKEKLKKNDVYLNNSPTNNILSVTSSSPNNTSNNSNSNSSNTNNSNNIQHHDITYYKYPQNAPTEKRTDFLLPQFQQQQQQQAGNNSNGKIGGIVKSPSSSSIIYKNNNNNGSNLSSSSSTITTTVEYQKLSSDNLSSPVIKVKKNLAVSIPSTKRLLESERPRKMSNADEVNLYFKLKQRETDFAHSLTCAVSPFQYLDEREMSDNLKLVDFKVELSFDGYTKWYSEMSKKVIQKTAMVQNKDKSAEIAQEEKKTGYRGAMETKKNKIFKKKKKKPPKNEDEQRQLDFIKRHLHGTGEKTPPNKNVVVSAINNPATSELQITTHVNNVSLSNNTSGVNSLVSTNSSLSLIRNSNSNNNIANLLSDQIGKPQNENNNNNGQTLPTVNENTNEKDKDNYRNSVKINGINLSTISENGDQQQQQQPQQQQQQQRQLPRRLNSSQSIVTSPQQGQSQLLTSPASTTSKPQPRRLNSSQNMQADGSAAEHEDTNSIDTSYSSIYDDGEYGNGNHESGNNNGNGNNSKMAQTQIMKIGKKFLAFFSKARKSAANQNGNQNGNCLDNNLSPPSTLINAHYLQRTQSQSSLLHSPRFNLDFNPIDNGHSPPLLNRSQSHISLQSRPTPRSQYDNSSSFNLTPRTFYNGGPLSSSQQSTAGLISPTSNQSNHSNNNNLNQNNNHTPNHNQTLHNKPQNNNNNLVNTPLHALMNLSNLSNDYNSNDTGNNSNNELDDDEGSTSASASSTPSSSPSSSPPSSPEPSPPQRINFFKTIHISHPKKPR